MIPILTIEELVESLDNADPSEYSKIFKRINIDASQFEAYSTWTKECYTRNCLARTESYELILLCWDIGAKTPIHGHGGENCWVYQVQGEVEELRYEKNDGCLKESNRMQLGPGKLTYMHDRMGYHSLRNTSNTRAMTLHIYASPIDFCEVFNDHSDCFEIKEMSYDTIVEEKVNSIVF